MLKINIYWHKCSCHKCDDGQRTTDGRNDAIKSEGVGKRWWLWWYGGGCKKLDSVT